MSFTYAQLAAQLNDPNLATWAATNAASQPAHLAAFNTYFLAVQAWITANGGTTTFGTVIPDPTSTGPVPRGMVDSTGLLSSTGATPRIVGATIAPFTDVFHDIPTFAPTPNFSLAQAAGNIQRLIRMLNNPAGILP